MKTKLLQIAFWLEGISITLFLAKAVRYGIDPYGWGWPSDVRLAVYRILAFAVLVIALTVFLYRIRIIGDLYRLLALLVLIYFTWNVGLRIDRVPFSYFLPSIDDRAERIGITESQFSLLEPCEQIDAFTTVAALSVSPWDFSYNIPLWMVTEVNDIPASTISACIAKNLNELVSKYKGPEEVDENTEREIYALVSLAVHMNVARDPDVLSAIRPAICDLDADPFGKLAIEYSLYTSGYLQDFDYYSKEGKAELKKMICQ